MIYLTYNDPPSGIYSSQVIDVCDFLNKKADANIRLLAIISLKNFNKNKNKILIEFPTAIVLPMFPGVQNWKWNYALLFFVFVFMGKHSVIARGPFAASLALGLKKIGLVKSVCFDARGAYDAEFNEYDVAQNKNLNRDIFKIEERSVLSSDYRMAVSNMLVTYWKAKFGYKKNDHVIIPCTVNSRSSLKLPDENAFNAKKKSLGFLNEDIVFVYSGSSAGWQSFKLMDEFLYKEMHSNKNIKVLFLGNKIPSDMRIVSEFRQRVIVKWLSNDEVFAALACCDYGLLIRESSITNKVSSPVKFAEYLASGIKVIISQGIGDYSEFVKGHDCGYVLNTSDVELNFPAISFKDRAVCVDIASKDFSKHTYLNEYRSVITNLHKGVKI